MMTMTTMMITTTIVPSKALADGRACLGRPRGRAGDCAAKEAEEEAHLRFHCFFFCTSMYILMSAGLEALHIYVYTYVSWA